jgi:hypothetical protein
VEMWILQRFHLAGRLAGPKYSNIHSNIANSVALNCTGTPHSLLHYLLYHPHNRMSTSTSYQLPEEQQAQVAALRDAVGIEVSSLLTDNDCMRFVRARKGDITKAATMASDWAAWWQKPFEDEELKGISPSTILKVQEVDPNEQLYTDLVRST